MTQSTVFIGRRAAIAGVCALALAGCAVLTVDVDVYKGPLANSAQIQTEQLAALAVGAKPVLIELRNRLESQECFRLEKSRRSINSLTQEQFDLDVLSAARTKAGSSKEFNFQKQCPFLPQVIYQNLTSDPDKTAMGGDPVANIENSMLVSSDARRVHEILKLYRDRERSDPILRAQLTDFIKRINDRFKRVVEQWTIANAEASTLAKTFFFNRSDIVKETGAAEALRRRVMHGNLSNVSGELPSVLLTVPRVQDLLDAMQADASVTSSTLSQTEHAVEKLSSRETYALRRLVAPDDEGTKASLELANIAAEALSDVLTLLKDPDFRARASTRSPLIVDTLASVAADLWSPEPLQLLVRNGGKGFPLANWPRIAAFAEANQAEGLAAEGNKSEETEAPLRAGLALALAQQQPSSPSDPTPAGAVFADQLLRQHHRLRKSPWFGGPSGLARFPQAAPTSPIAKEGLDRLERRRRQLDTAITALRSALSGALDRGRPDKGIDTLAEAYLRAEVERGPEDSCDPSKSEKRQACETVKAKEHELFDALVNFSQKLLVIANNDALLRERPGDAKAQQYVRVLQAIGNSILYQVDEKQKRRTHDAAIERNRGIHTQAALDARESASPVLLSEIKAGVGRFGTRLVKQPPDLRKSLDETAGSIKTIQTWLALEAAEQHQRLATSQQELTNYDAVLGVLNSNAIGAAFDTCDPSDQPFSTFKNSLRDKILVMDKDVFEEVVDKALKAQVASTFCPKQWLAKCKASTEDLKKIENVNQRELQEVATAVERWLATLHDSAVPKLEGQANIQQTYELMIQTLRLRHVDALAHGETARAAELAASIAQAERYHYGSMYLSPAMAFLRNSFPATVLQDDASTQWKNMLDNQVGRSMPGYSPAEEAKIQNTIDKQFWQNINRIRLSGMGSTNYAVTKDDVGNWYVKGYANDTKTMIQAFKSVALFSLGGNVRAQLAGNGLAGIPQAPTGSSTPAPGAPSPNTPIPQKPTGARSTLQKQYDLFTGQYTDKLAEAQKALSEPLSDKKKTGFVEGVRAAIMSAPKSKAPPADEAKRLAPDFDTSGYYDQHKVEIDHAFQDDPRKKTAKELQADLNLLTTAVLKYREQVRRTILESKSTAPADPAWKTPDNIDLLAKAAGAYVAKFLDDTLTKRAKLNDEYDTALLVLGKSIGMKTE